MHRHFRALAYLILTLAVAAAPTAAQTSPSSSASAPSFKELLDHLTAFGESRFSPDGRKLLFTTRRFGPTHGATLDFQSLYVADLKSGEAHEIAAQAEGAAFEACATWAPDGKGIAYLQRRGAEITLAYFDLTNGRKVVFGPPTRTFCNSWVGRKLVYATSEGAPQEAVSAAAAVENVSRRWRAAWETDAPQLTIHSSDPDFPSPASSEGGIAIADPATGETVLAARGTFDVILFPSPDTRHFAALRKAEPFVGALEQAPLRKVGLLAANSLRIEPYTTPLKVVPIEDDAKK